MSFSKSLISVIVPIYNVQDYLKRCVDSILSQTCKNLEIILVDDGSTDGSSLICDQYAVLDERVRVIHKINGGLSSARNAGLNVATGDYIGFVDGDDYIDEKMYENLLAPFLIYKNIVLTMGQVKVDNNGILSDFMCCSQTIQLIKGRIYFLDAISGKMTVAVWCKLYLADVVKKVRFIEGKLNEDSLFAFDMSNLIADKDICIIPEFVYFYCKREGSICNSLKPLCIDIIENLCYMEKKCKDMCDIRYSVIHSMYILNLFYFNRAMLDHDSWYDSFSDPYYKKFCNLTFKEFMSVPRRKIVPYQYFAIKYARPVYRFLLRCRAYLCSHF